MVLTIPASSNVTATGVTAESAYNKAAGNGGRLY